MEGVARERARAGPSVVQGPGQGTLSLASVGSVAIGSPKEELERDGSLCEVPELAVQ